MCPPPPLVFVRMLDTCQLVLSVLRVSELVGGDQPIVTGNGCVMGLQTVARCSLTDYRSSFNCGDRAITKSLQAMGKSWDKLGSSRPPDVKKSRGVSGAVLSSYCLFTASATPAPHVRGQRRHVDLWRRRELTNL